SRGPHHRRRGTRVPRRARGRVRPAVRRARPSRWRSRRGRRVARVSRRARGAAPVNPRPRPRARRTRGRPRAPDPRRPGFARGGRMTVYLVGAGPGDPGLLTVRGAELLAGADVVVYDRLASPALLALAPADARLIAAGKAPGQVDLTQDEINEVLVEQG